MPGLFKTGADGDLGTGETTLGRKGPGGGCNGRDSLVLSEIASADAEGGRVGDRGRSGRTGELGTDMFSSTFTLTARGSGTELVGPGIGEDRIDGAEGSIGPVETS